MPVHKIGSKFDISNYRPIAKISNIAKLFERTIFKKLSFLIRSYIEPNQHGFMPGRSTTTNLAAFTNHCIHDFEDHLQMDTIYTDFAKVFDTACHFALKAKLSELGFHSSFLNWIASYLDKRRYHVEVGGALL